MLPATTWNDNDWGNVRARGWSVVARLELRQQRLKSELTDARRRQAERARSNRLQMMTAASMQHIKNDAALIRNSTECSVVALLFAPPDTDAIRILDSRGGQLDVRSGDTWDLFFAGYYKSKDPQLESSVGAVRAGERWARDWWFNGADFDHLRRYIEDMCKRKWVYSGKTDLVLITAYVSAKGSVTIDWDSVQSGSVTDAQDGTSSLTLGEIVQRISDDLEQDIQDAAYGVGAVTSPVNETGDSTGKKIVIGAIAGIAAAFGKSAMGM